MSVSVPVHRGVAMINLLMVMVMITIEPATSSVKFTPPVGRKLIMKRHSKPGQPAVAQSTDSDIRVYIQVFGALRFGFKDMFSHNDHCPTGRLYPKPKLCRPSFTIAV